MFNEEKATEAAALILQRGGGKMYHLKVMKLLYIAERRAIQKWGRSITWDNFVSMDNGPVLSNTLNLINGSLPNTKHWDNAISDRANHQIRLTVNEFKPSKLSKAEIKLIYEVFDEFRNTNRFDLCDRTHEFQEWEDPDGSSIPISIEAILKAGNWTEEEIGQILEEHEAISGAQAVI